MRNIGFEKGKVVGKWTVRLPAGSVADAASNPAHSNPRLGAPLWSVEVYVPASRIDRKNAKVNAIKFSHGEVCIYHTSCTRWHIRAAVAFRGGCRPFGGSVAQRCGVVVCACSGPMTQRCGVVVCACSGSVAQRCRIRIGYLVVVVQLGIHLLDHFIPDTATAHFFPATVGLPLCGDTMYSSNCGSRERMCGLSIQNC